MEEKKRKDEKQEAEQGKLIISRREFLENIKKWSPAVTMLFLGGSLATTTLMTSGCPSYSRYDRYDVYGVYAAYAAYNRSGYSRYARYCNITYCNGCCHSYTVPGGTCYCNYVDYSDACC